MENVEETRSQELIPVTTAKPWQRFWKEVEESASLGRRQREEWARDVQSPLCKEQGLEQVLSGGGFPPPQRLVAVLRRQEAAASFLQQVFIFCQINR